MKKANILYKVVFLLLTAFGAAILTSYDYALKDEKFQDDCEDNPIQVIDHANLNGAHNSLLTQICSEENSKLFIWPFWKENLDQFTDHFIGEGAAIN